MSLISNANMISKVYFPRIIIPTAAMMVSLIDFCISFVLLIIMMLCWKVFPRIETLMMPVFLALAVISSLGMGYWISALNVKFRDFRYLVPFVLQFGLYITPVGFKSDLVPDGWRLIYSLNPMVGVIDGFRWIILGNEFQMNLPSFFTSCIVAVIMFVSGVCFFFKTERQFADYI